MSTGTVAGLRRSRRASDARRGAHVGVERVIFRGELAALPADPWMAALELHFQANPRAGIRGVRVRGASQGSEGGEGARRMPVGVLEKPRTMIVGGCGCSASVPGHKVEGRSVERCHDLTRAVRREGRSRVCWRCAKHPGRSQDRTTARPAPREPGQHDRRTHRRGRWGPPGTAFASLTRPRASARRPGPGVPLEDRRGGAVVVAGLG